MTPYENLVSACVALVEDSARGAALEEAAFRYMAARDEAAILAAALGASE